MTTTAHTVELLNSENCAVEVSEFTVKLFCDIINKILVFFQEVRNAHA